MTHDEQFMREAILLSELAVEHGNEPFGAVLVKDGEIAADGTKEDVLPKLFGTMTGCRFTEGN